MPNDQPPAGYHDASAQAGGPPPGYHDASAGAMAASPQAQPKVVMPSNVGDPLNVPEREAVNSPQNTGNPLNLKGEGGLGKLQGSLWSLENTLAGKQYAEQSNWPKNVHKPSAETDFFNPYTWKRMGLDVGADLTGVIGSAAQHPGLTAGAMIPYVKAALAPYFVYQGASMASHPRQPNETEPDFFQRVLLGGSMAAGGAAQTGESGANTAKTFTDFAKRARTMEAVHQGATATIMGDIVPAFKNLDTHLSANIGNLASYLTVPDARDNALNQRPVVSLPDGSQQHTGVIPGHELFKAMQDSETNLKHEVGDMTLSNIAGNASKRMYTMSDAITERTRIGNAAARLSRASGTQAAKDAAVGWEMYNKMGDLIQDRAKQLSSQPGASFGDLTDKFGQYNSEAKALFEHRSGIPGKIMDWMERPGTPKQPKPAMDLLADKNSEQELNEIRARMQNKSMPLDAYDAALKRMKPLSEASDDIHKQYARSLYRAMSHPDSVALAGLGTYLALHGAGVYGFAPLLIANLTMGATGPTKNAMAAGRAIRESSGPTNILTPTSEAVPNADTLIQGIAGQNSGGPPPAGAAPAGGGSPPPAAPGAPSPQPNIPSEPRPAAGESSTAYGDVHPKALSAAYLQVQKLLAERAAGKHLSNTVDKYMADARTAPADVAAAQAAKKGKKK